MAAAEASLPHGSTADIAQMLAAFARVGLPENGSLTARGTRVALRTLRAASPQVNFCLWVGCRGSGKGWDFNCVFGIHQFLVPRGGKASATKGSTADAALMLVDVMCSVAVCSAFLMAGYSSEHTTAAMLRLLARPASAAQQDRQGGLG